MNSFSGPAGAPATQFRDLFNGNIGGMLTNIRQLNEPMYYRYSYDQLNRIKSMNAFRGQDAAANGWPSLQATADYQEQVSYDGNGNILSYQRSGRAATGLGMDNLGYSYRPNTNQLSHVTDAVLDGAYGEDVDGQTAGNYGYDLVGNLTSDNKEGISAIRWTVYGKIRSISKAGSSVQYRYDASGNRIHKLVQAGGLDTHTYYVRDAQGNVMSVYDRVASTATGVNTVDLRWTEQHLYGSSRLGMWLFQQVVPAGPPVPATGGSLEDAYIYGSKFFELSNHLGNVLATVSDKKIGVDDGNNGTTDYFNVDVVSAQDYYPFGMVMPGRKFAAPSSSYRYGFNGKENDNEVKGEGNQQDYGMRIYDPRVGRFLSVDPIFRQYPELTPYQFASNRPIDGIDQDGLEYSPAGQSNGQSVDGTAVKLYPSHPAQILQDKANIASAAMQQQRTFVQPANQAPRTFQEKLEHERLRQTSFDKAGLDRDGNPKPGTVLMEGKTFNRLNDNIVEPMMLMGTVGEGVGLVGLFRYSTLKIGWKVGEPVTNLTSKGVIPSWSTVRQRFWKNEAAANPSVYSKANILRMEKGLAPQRINPITGALESMELHHHVMPQRNGGLFQFIKVWPDEHRAIDPFRR